MHIVPIESNSDHLPACDSSAGSGSGVPAQPTSPAERGHISLKWGTLKAWQTNSEKGRELLERYLAAGMSFGAMQQNDTAEQKELLCGLIDECNDPDGIFMDWDGKYVTKDEAKKYVREYGAHKATGAQA